MRENWAEMIEKRNEFLRQEQEVHMEADIQVALEVGRMAELGWFDVEFTMYGCAYLDPVDEKIYFKVSSNAEDIYDFMENGMQKNIYAGNMMQLTRKCPVPSGMKELIAQDVKHELARQLRDTYPKQFFHELYALAHQFIDNSAVELLWDEAEALEGVFEEERLNQFEELIRYAYSCLRVDVSTYHQLLAWVKEEHRNMDDDFISKDILEKTFYGLAYEQDGIIRYIDNAQREYVYEKQYKLEQQGYFVAPIYAKTYWYNYEYRLQDVRKNFRADLKNERDIVYLDKIKRIKTKNKGITTDFQTFVEYAEENWNRACAETLMRYGHRWGIL